MPRRRGSQYVLLLIMLTAIELILAFVPAIGFVDLSAVLPKSIFAVTTLHIPVVVGAVVLGGGAGAFLGLIYGLCHLVSASFLVFDPIMSPLFTPFVSTGQIAPSMLSLLICIVPPILAGLVTALLVRVLGRMLHGVAITFMIAGGLGALVNWGLTLLGVMAVFGGPLSEALGTGASAIAASAACVNLPLEMLLGIIFAGGAGTGLYNKFIRPH